MSRERARERERARDAGFRAYVRVVKDQPCTDCGEWLPPECMDLDHVRGTKRWNIASAKARSFTALQLEILKCEVVCANCHRKRTAASQQWR